MTRAHLHLCQSCVTCTNRPCTHRLTQPGASLHPSFIPLFSHSLSSLSFCTFRCLNAESYSLVEGLHHPIFRKNLHPTYFSSLSPPFSLSGSCKQIRKCIPVEHMFPLSFCAQCRFIFVIINKTLVFVKLLGTSPPLFVL